MSQSNRIGDLRPTTLLAAGIIAASIGMHAQTNGGPERLRRWPST